MLERLKNFFIPHEGNSFAPHSLQKQAMLVMSLLIFITFLGTNLQSLLWTSSKWMVSTVLPGVIVELTNDERADNNLPALKRNSVLDEAAKMKAQDMAKNEYFAHYSPTGVSPWHWFAEANYNFIHAGENLAIHFTDSSDVVDAWMESPTHRANIVNANYKEIGVGTAEGTYQGFKTVYVVQLFGAPAATPAVAAAVAPEPAKPAPVVVAVAPKPAAVTTNETEPVTDEDTEPVDVASEAVAITENVEIIAAEPVPTTILTEVVPTSTETVPATEVTDMEATDHGVALFSDHMSTSAPGIPATIEPEADNGTGGTTPYLYELATQPQTVLQIIYTLLALFVVGSLIASIVIEIRKQQPIQIAYGLAMLLLMAGLLSLHIATTTGALIT